MSELLPDLRHRWAIEAAERAEQASAIADAQPEDDEIVHIYQTCCPPFERYLCGQPVPPNDRVAERGNNVCVVCEDLEETWTGPCRWCGK